MGSTTTTGRGTRSTTTMGGTLDGTSAWAAVREAFVAEGGPEAVRAVGAWLSRCWGRVRGAVARVAREFSPVLPCMAEAVPSLPAVESVQCPTYAAPVVSVTAECQRWVYPEAVREVPSAVQRLEAERVTAGEVVYRKDSRGRYHAVTHPEAFPGTVYRRTTHGKATRYHAV